MRWREKERETDIEMTDTERKYKRQTDRQRKWGVENIYINQKKQLKL